MAPSNVGRVLQCGMDDTFDQMTHALRQHGLVSALAVLNAHVRQRYSAVYRLSAEGQLINLALVDKLEEPAPEFLMSVPYSVSFCQFTLKYGEFRTSNSALDDRLEGHPFKGVMNSYFAVPFVSTHGAVTGTICHFDTVAMPLPDEDLELLRLASRVFPTFLPR